MYDYIIGIIYIMCIICIIEIYILNTCWIFSTCLPGFSPRAGPGTAQRPEESLPQLSPASPKAAKDL